MNPRPLTATLLSAVCALTGVSTQALSAAVSVPKPNIVVIFVDDWGSSDVPWSPHVRDDVKLPNLMKLRNEGVSCSTA